MILAPDPESRAIPDRKGDAAMQIEAAGNLIAFFSVLSEWDSRSRGDESSESADEQFLPQCRLEAEAP